MRQHRTDTAESDPLTIDGASGLPDPTPREIKLKTADDIRVEMADGTKLAYVLGQIGKVIELVEIEKRIALLEREIP